MTHASDELQHLREFFDQESDPSDRTWATVWTRLDHEIAAEGEAAGNNPHHVANVETLSGDNSSPAPGAPVADHHMTRYRFVQMKVAAITIVGVAAVALALLLL